MNEHDAYKARVRARIEETKAASLPTASAKLPEGHKLDQLRWIEWDAATRDSIILYDGTSLYEQHVDDVTLMDRQEANAFYELMARTAVRAGDQHMFAADVLEDLKDLEADDA